MRLVKYACMCSMMLLASIDTLFSGYFDYSQIPNFGGGATVANWVNQNDLIVGSYLNTETNLVHAFQYNLATQAFLDLGTLPGQNESVAIAVDLNQDIVGVSGFETFFKLQNKAPQSIGFSSPVMTGPTPDTILVPFICDATAMNENGDVVGSQTFHNQNNQTFTRPMFYNRRTGVIDLGLTTGSNGNGQANGINLVGEVVGFVNNAQGNPTATMWTLVNNSQWKKTVFSINSLTGFPAGTQSSLANSINTVHEVVGSYINANGKRRAFHWTSSGGVIDLGTLNGDDQAIAQFINDDSVVVGISINSQTSTQRVFAWTVETGMMDLYFPPGDDLRVSSLNKLGDATIVVDETDSYIIHTQNLT
jgi:probable HAF family extracellular repeat protein